MRNILVAAAGALILTACGGGGGTSGTSTTPVATTPAPQLASYIGNWASSCYNHAIDSAAITRTPGTTDSLTIAFKTDYYINANCTGNIVATWTQGANATAVYSGTVDSSIVFTPGAAAVAAKVDKVTATMPQTTASVTGTGVVHTVVNGQAQWCINYGNGNTNCIKDEGTIAPTSQPGGLYLQGNVLYELVPSGSIYTVNEAFNKQ